MKSVDVKCCVVGAGVSGLKAVHTLLNDPKSKFKPQDILLVEAQDYIGGRVCTDKTSSKLGYSYDLGAAWFHDALTNINLQEAIEEKDKELFDFDKDGYFDDKDIKYYQRSEIPIKELKMTAVMEEVEKFIELYYFEDLAARDMSLLEITDIYLQKYEKRLTGPQIKYVKQFIRYYELWFGISSDKISAKYAIMSHQGRNLYNLKGYSYLLDKMLANIPKDRILLDQPVRKIVRNNKEGSRRLALETPHLQIFCDYAVITTPLSILRLPESDPFGITWQPKLPEPLTNSLEKIHFGALGKVIFEFDDIWWDRDEDRMVVFPEEPVPKDLSKPLAKLPEKLQYPYLIVNYEALHQHDNVKTHATGGSFVILTQSPLTEYLESHPEQAWDYYKESFKALVVPGKQLRAPINVMTSKWTTKPYIRGAYSALHVDDDPQEIIVQLSGEIEGAGLSSTTVRFAGEHTIADGDGCVHGAYMSGAREGQWIIGHYNSLQPNL